MKGKLYAFGVVGVIALFTIGFLAKTEYYKPVYQAKDYSGLKYEFGLAKYGSEFLRMMREDENGEINPKDVIAARRNVARNSSEKDPASWMFWDYIGPNFVGGRTRAIIVDNQPNKQNNLYIGSISGGVYFSYDGAATWQNRTGDLGNLNVSDITQTPNGTLFIGTGCSHNENGGAHTSGGFPGGGLFRRSEDGNGNSNYTLLKGTTGVGSTVGWGIINRLVSHPTENKIYVGTGSGLQVATDAMADPSNITFFNPVTVNGFDISSTVDDIAISSDGSVIYVAFTSRNSIFKLKDNGGGDITVEKEINMPSGNGTIRRTSLAISPQDPNILYASVANTGSALYGVFQTKDGGDTWNTIGTKGTDFDPLCQIGGNNCQGLYDMAIGVSPIDAGKILFGGVSLWMWNESKTNPGTGGWTKVATTSGNNNNLVDTNYVHADKHRIVFADGDVVYVASDGGIAKSIDGGYTWSQNNNGYGATQFYAIDCAFEGENISGNFPTELVMGGTQDNGTQIVGFNASRPTAGTEIGGGDGFSCNFSNLANLSFTSVYNGTIVRLGLNGGGGTFYDKELEDLDCGSGIPGCGPFYTVFEYWEIAYADDTKDSIKLFNRDSTIVVKKGDDVTYPSDLGNVPMTWPAPKDLNFGDSAMMPDFAQSKFIFATSDGGAADKVYMTRDAANLNRVTTRWDLIADGSNSYPDKMTGSVFNIEFTDDGNQVYLSTRDGDIYRIDNLNEGYDSLTLDIRSPQCVLTCTKIYNGNGFITSMSLDPNSSDNLIITYGGFGAGSKIYRITGASIAPTNGVSRESIMGDFPANVPVYASIIAEHDKNTVVVGTEFGIYATDMAFNSISPEWHYAYGVARLAVFDLVQQDEEFLYNKGPEIKNIHYRNMYAGTHGAGFLKTGSLVGLEDKNGEGGKTVTSVDPVYFNVYPNPMNTNGYIDLDIPENQQVKIDIFDLNGKLINTVQNGVMSKGKSRLTFNAMDLRNGSYIATLRTNDELKVSKFVVIR